MQKSGLSEIISKRSNLIYTCLPFFTGIIYFVSNPTPQNYHDYTFRVAGNFLHGAIGFAEQPPLWLNEFVPFEGLYYSVFPLGSILSMVPFKLITLLVGVDTMPGDAIAALLGAMSCYYLLKITTHYDHSTERRLLLTIAILFGTWMWTNLTMAGAWQLALGFSVVGELGAIYYTVFERKPWLAGAFFALAFGNRTEVLLTAPIFLYLLVRRDAGTWGPIENGGDSSSIPTDRPDLRSKVVRLSALCSFPFVLGVATLLYNYVRFHSIFDFGYARIPGVLSEPWYNHGIFSIAYIPHQAWEMLWKPWELREKFPYFAPEGFSSSIFWCSPFLVFLLRFGARDRVLKYTAWLAIGILTFTLWIHGNSGGWQFGYRYAMILLPWIFIILLENSPQRITRVEWVAYSVSLAANGYATWLFNWTDYLKP
jgi:hypothetical protein